MKCFFPFFVDHLYLNMSAELHHYRGVDTNLPLWLLWEGYRTSRITAVIYAFVWCMRCYLAPKQCNNQDNSCGIRVKLRSGWGRNFFSFVFEIDTEVEQKISWCMKRATWPPISTVINGVNIGRNCLDSLNALWTWSKFVCMKRAEEQVASDIHSRARKIGNSAHPWLEIHR